jgi:oxalate decarboxylase/phosphoglucose isomerase-like protein (cupin superfamily)
MDIRRLDRENLTVAYGIDSERLLPWPVLNAPFEGAWCVVHAGGASDAHAHHEYEIFIAMSGSAQLVVEDERGAFKAGDIAFLTPGREHNVVNDSDADFEFYAIWWDPQMSADFVARHGEPAGKES